MYDVMETEIITWTIILVAMECLTMMECTYV